MPDELVTETWLREAGWRTPPGFPLHWERTVAMGVLVRLSRHTAGYWRAVRVEQGIASPAGHVTTVSELTDLCRRVGGPG